MDEEVVAQLGWLIALLKAADAALNNAHRAAENAARLNPAFDFRPRVSVALDSLRNLRADVRGVLPEEPEEGARG
jgi:hypothetical protein